MVIYKNLCVFVSLWFNISMLLSGDIGGTKTILALISPQAGPCDPLVEIRFPSAAYPNLETIIQEFLEQLDPPIAPASLTATFGVAGPVIQGKSAITNLPWVLDEFKLSQAIGIPAVTLLNDMAATAYAVPFLEPHELHRLRAGEPDPSGAIAVIAPGTGLGEGFLTRQGQTYQAHPSEGGHSSFAPQNLLELELLRYLIERFDHVSTERVCSGQGIPNIYAFLKDKGYAEEPPWLAEKLAAADDPTPVICKAALDQSRPCPLCAATLETFVSILGAEAGNLAAKVAATGGIYLGGGIPPHILPALENKCFLQALQQKGRLSDMLAHIPIYVILNPKAALLGVACHGLGLMPG